MRTAPFIAVVTVALCALAAFRLRATPLLVTAGIVTVANAVAHVAGVIVRRRGRSDSRVATALQHVTAALGSFFLLVSFSLP